MIELVARHLDLGPALDRRFAEARERWPGVVVDRDEFFTSVCDRLAGEANPIAALGRLHVTDLYLAHALEHRDPCAIAVLEREFLREVAAYVARLDPSPAFADEIRQFMRDRLLVAAPGERPRIAAYAGSGPLGGWLRVIAIRLARNQRRGKAAAALPVDDAELLPSPQPDPEIDYLKARYATQVRRAFTRTLEELPEEQRNVLRLYFLDGMTLGAIGRLYGVHESTISRWIERARRQLLDETRRLLADQIGASPAEAASVVGLVASRLDVSIRRIFG